MIHRIDRSWQAGGIAGLIAGVVMGGILHAVLGLMPLIGGLVGMETVIVGWIVHLFNSAAFGVLFVWLFERPLFDDLRGDRGGYLALGTIHSAVLGLITGGILLPASIALSGATSLPIPTLPLPGVTAGLEFAVVIAVAHAVYGLVLGGVYARIVDITDLAPDIPLTPGT